MTLQKGTFDGFPIFEDSGAVGTPVTNLTEDGGDILATVAEDSARKNNQLAPGKGEVYRVSSAGAVTKYQSTDPTDDVTTSGNPNATALTNAAAALANGDTLIIGPGTYYKSTLNIAADDITIIAHGCLIKRPDSTNAVYVMELNGDDIRVYGSAVVDGNQAQNKSAYSASTNEHHGIRVTGNRHYLSGWKVQNTCCGSASTLVGYGVKTLSFGKGLIVDGMQFENCSASMHIRADNWLLQNVISVNPNPFGGITTADDQADRLTKNVGQWDGVFQIDTRQWFVLSGADYTNNSHWTDVSLFIRHIDCDTHANTVDLAAVRGGFWYADKYAYCNFGFGTASECRLFVVDGLMLKNTIRAYPTTQGYVKTNYAVKRIIRNCSWQGAGDFSLNATAAGGMPSSPNISMLIADCDFSGSISAADDRFELIEIQRSKIGSADLSQVNNALSSVNTDHLKIQDSWIGGGSSNCITFSTSRAADRVELVDTVLSVNSSGSAYATTGCNAMWTNIDNLTYENTGSGTTYLANDSLERLRLTGSDRWAFEFNEEAFVPAVRHSGTCLGAGSDDDEIELASGGVDSDDEHNRKRIRLTGGTGSGQIRAIKDSTDTGDLVQVYYNWDTNPVNGSTTYEIYQISGTGTASDIHPDPWSTPRFNNLDGQPGQRIWAKHRGSSVLWFPQYWDWDEHLSDWVEGPFGPFHFISDEAASVVVAEYSTRDDYVYYVDAWCIASETVDHDEAAGYHLAGIFKNDGGTLSQVGSDVEPLTEEDTIGWDFTFQLLAGTPDRIRLLFDGAASTNIRGRVWYNVREIG